MSRKEIDSMMWVTGGNPRMMYSPIQATTSFTDHNLCKAYDLIASYNNLQINDFFNITQSYNTSILAMSPFDIKPVPECEIRKNLSNCDLEYLLDHNRLLVTCDAILPSVPLDLLRYLCHRENRDYTSIKTEVRNGLGAALVCWPSLLKILG